MKIIDIFKPKREVIEERSNITSFQSNTVMFGFNNENANVYLKKIPLLKKGVNLISTTIANLPIQLIKEENEEIAIVNDYRLKFLNRESNYITNANKFKAKLIEDMIIYGKGYAVIEKQGNIILGLHNVKFVNEKLMVDKNGFPVSSEISYILNGKQYSSDIEDMLIVENPNGSLYDNREVLNDIVDEYEAYSKMLKNSANPFGILKTEGRLNDAVIEKLRNAWNGLYSGKQNVGKTIILENGLEYEPIESNSFSMVDTKKAEEVIGNKIEDILNLPYGYLTTKAEHEDTEILLQNTITPLVVALEEALSKCLLLEREKDKNMFTINSKELLKTNDETYQKSIIELYKIGLITLKQARKMLDFETVSVKEDMNLWSLGNIIHYPNTNKIFTPNTGIMADMNMIIEDKV